MVRLETIINSTLRVLGVEWVEFVGSGRSERAVLAREMVAFLARQHTRLSYPEIARGMNRTSHATVFAAERRINDAINAEELGKVVNLGGDVYTMHELASKIEGEFAGVLMSPSV